MIAVLLHFIGDYIIQNDYMHSNKKRLTWKGELACHLHCLTYSIPFLAIADWKAVVMIYTAHYLIDRTNLVAWFIAIKNGQISIKKAKQIEYGKNLGKSFPHFITDNLIHIISNGIILNYF